MISKTATIVITGIKIAEFISLLIATATAGNFLTQRRDEEESSPTLYELGSYGRLDFFLFSTSIGMIIAMATFALFITGLQEKASAQALITIDGMWALTLLVSSALLAKTVDALDTKILGQRSTCKTWDEFDKDYQCSHLITAVVFGFLAMAFFLLDFMMGIVNYMTTQNSQAKQSPTVVSNSLAAGINGETKTNPAVVHA